MTVKKTILCVDNEQSLSIQKLTLQTRGYRVMTCNTTAEAMVIFGNVSVDLVLSNVELPDASVTDLVTRIKTISPEIPVILLSDQKLVFETDAPVDLLLRKGSYAPADLLERIRILLVKRRGPRRAVSSVLARGAHAC
jgi:DNA-binding response OmpR family regulator